MRSRSSLRLPIVAACLLGAAACGSVAPQRAMTSGRAVVVYAPDREPDAVEAAVRLRAAGFEVESEVEGPPVRKRSSVAVYRIAREDEDVVTPAEQALAFLPDIEWLPFVHPGPPHTDVVVWLVSAERDAAAR